MRARTLFPDDSIYGSFPMQFLPNYVLIAVHKGNLLKHRR